MTSIAPDISVVVPVFNEQDSLTELHTRVAAVLDGIKKTFEIIFVDDGSTDGSLSVLRALRQTDPRVRVVRLARNFGQTPALYAGFSRAAGQCVVMIDADLQNYPEDIPKLIEKLDEGYDMVSGRRTLRQEGLFRRAASRLVNAYIARVTRLPLHDYGCALKAFRRDLVNRMGLLDHRCRYLPVDTAWLSSAVAEVEVRDASRAEGVSKYGFLKLIRTSFDLMTSITAAPLQLFGLLGWVFAFTGFAMGLRVAYNRIRLGNVLQVESVIAIFFFLAGVQLVATGLMCEYVSRIYTEVQRKPLFIIREELE